MDENSMICLFTWCFSIANCYQRVIDSNDPGYIYIYIYQKKYPPGPPSHQTNIGPSHDPRHSSRVVVSGFRGHNRSDFPGGVPGGLQRNQGAILPRDEAEKRNETNEDTCWFIPLSKWVITLVISGLTRLIPFTTRVITHLLSGMNHQVHIHYHTLQ